MDTYGFLATPWGETEMVVVCLSQLWASEGTQAAGLPRKVFGRKTLSRQPYSFPSVKARLAKRLDSLRVLNADLKLNQRASRAARAPH